MDTFWEDLQRLYDAEHDMIMQNMEPERDRKESKDREENENFEVPF